MAWFRLEDEKPLSKIMAVGKPTGLKNGGWTSRVMSWNDGNTSDPPPPGCWLVTTRMTFLDFGDPNLKPAITCHQPASPGCRLYTSKVYRFSSRKTSICLQTLPIFRPCKLRCFFLGLVGLLMLLSCSFFWLKATGARIQVKIYEKFGGILGCFWSLSLGNSTKITQKKWYIELVDSDGYWSISANLNWKTHRIHYFSSRRFMRDWNQRNSQELATFKLISWPYM